MRYETKQEALREAHAKRNLLHQPRNWKIRVWENMGWHWSLHNGTLSLYYDKYGKGKGTFSALMSDGRYEGVGESYWTSRFFHSNPNMVVADQMNLARVFLRTIQSSIDSVKL